MPNKEGGYAPANYYAIGGQRRRGGIHRRLRRLIGTPNEHSELLASMDRIEENLGQKPHSAAADGASPRASIWKAWRSAASTSARRWNSPEPQPGNVKPCVPTTAAGGGSA